MEECPKCGEKLNYFSGLEYIPACLYCPVCNDTAYDEDGNILFPIE
jgi:ssDNA-binding Zn-finger/Zn-ribbon topoisomerase 1